MEEILKIKLSFDDSKTTVTRRGNKTIVRLTSYFKLDDFKPSGVYDYAFEDKARDLGYEYNDGIMVNVTRGVVELQDGDVDDQAAAVRMASTKAKVKAYDRFARLIEFDIQNTVEYLTKIRRVSDVVNKFYTDEKAALERCIKTGYCDPNRG